MIYDIVTRSKQRWIGVAPDLGTQKIDRMSDLLIGHDHDSFVWNDEDHKNKNNGTKGREDGSRDDLQKFRNPTGDGARSGRPTLDVLRVNSQHLLLLVTV